MTKILVTGANGYIGNALLEGLNVDREKYDVWGLVRGKAIDPSGVRKISLADWTDISAVTEVLTDFDVVVHCAAAVHKMRSVPADYFEYYRHNTVLTETLARAALAAGVKQFIYISTSKINGEFTEPGQKFHESDLFSGEDFYSLTKFFGEEKLKNVLDEHDCGFTILRLPLVIGPNAKGNLTTIKRLTNLGIPLPLLGVGNKRSVVDLANLVNIVQGVMFNPAAINQLFMVSDSPALTSREIIQRVCKYENINCRFFYLPLPMLRLLIWLIGGGGFAVRLLSNYEIDNKKLGRAVGSDLRLIHRSED